MEETNENKGEASPSPENAAGSETVAPPAASVEAAGASPEGAAVGKALFEGKGMDFLNDVSIAITIEVGRTQIKIRDLLNLSKDSIIDLNKGAGEPVDIYANGKLISRGNIITANGKYCVRLTSIAQPVVEKAE